MRNGDESSDEVQVGHQAGARISVDEYFITEDLCDEGSSSDLLSPSGGCMGRKVLLFLVLFLKSLFEEIEPHCISMSTKHVQVMVNILPNSERTEKCRTFSGSDLDPTLRLVPKRKN